MVWEPWSSGSWACKVRNGLWVTDYWFHSLLRLKAKTNIPLSSFFRGLFNQFWCVGILSFIAFLITFFQLHKLKEKYKANNPLRDITTISDGDLITLQLGFVRCWNTCFCGLPLALGLVLPEASVPLWCQGSGWEVRAQILAAAPAQLAAALGCISWAHWARFLTSPIHLPLPGSFYHSSLLNFISFPAFCLERGCWCIFRPIAMAWLQCLLLQKAFLDLLIPSSWAESHLLPPEP